MLKPFLPALELFLLLNHMDSLRRFVVVGTSGSGKTTFARQLAAARGITHIELDALHWEPNWVEAADDVFLERVDQATGPPAWVVDGNYSKARPFVWQRADAVCWLDFDFHLVMWRLFSRTVRRAFSQEELWKGNRESWRMSFMTRDSVLLWGLTTYHLRRREYQELLRSPESARLRVFHLKNPAQAQQFLRDAAAASGGAGNGTSDAESKSL